MGAWRQGAPGWRHWHAGTYSVGSMRAVAVLHAHGGGGGVGGTAYEEQSQQEVWVEEEGGTSGQQPAAASRHAVIRAAPQAC